MLLKCFPLCSPLSPHCVLLALSSRGEWSGWLSCLSGVFPGQGFPRLLSCPPTPSHEMLSTARRTYLGARLHLQSPASRSLPQELQPCQKQLCAAGLLAKEVSWEFSTAQRVPQVHPSSPTRTRVSGHFGGPGSQSVELGFLVQVLKLF